MVSATATGGSDELRRFSFSPDGKLLSGTSESFASNKVTNTKYNVFTFLPMNLFEQFHRPINLYFLFVTFLQFIPSLAPVSPMTSFIPLVFAFSLTAAKEGLDDYARGKQDAIVNTRKYVIIKRESCQRKSPKRDTTTMRSGATSGTHRDSSKNHSSNEYDYLSSPFSSSLCSSATTVIESQDIEVGDVVVLTAKESVPADIIVLTSSTGKDLVAHCSTENLDGEADAKQKICLLPPAPRNSSVASGSLVPLEEGGFGSPGLGNVSAVKMAEDKQQSELEAAIEYCRQLHPHLTVAYEKPSIALHQFTGTLEVKEEGMPTYNTGRGRTASGSASVRSSLATPSSTSTRGPEKLSCSVDNLMLSSSTIRATDFVLGLVVYTGNETRVGMNKKHPPVKWARLDKRLNRFVLAVFVFQFLSVISFAVLGLFWYRRHQNEDWYIYAGGDSEERGWPHFMFVVPVRFFLLGSLMIPISFKVIVDCSKYYTSLVIQWDLLMYDAKTDTSAKVNNTSLAEDLGQIQFLLTDKTGTLTENRMIFRHLADVKGKEVFPYTTTQRYHKDTERPDFEEVTEGEGKSHKMLLRVLALCNTVQRESHSLKLPEHFHFQRQKSSYTDVTAAAFVDGNEPQDVEWTSPSPDEVALVAGAAERGYQLLTRSRRHATVKNVLEPSAPQHGGEEGARRSQGTGRAEEKRIERFEVLHVLPFSSSRARMSVLVKLLPHDEESAFEGRTDETGAEDTAEEENAEYFLLVKGADERVLPLCEPSSFDKPIVERTLQQYSVVGLRTLVLAYRKLPSTGYAKEWLAKVHEALTLEVNDERNAAIAQWYNDIEKELVCLGVTAIQDNLQTGVPQTIEKLRQAAVNVWMLTGDKLETAEQISYASALLQRGRENVYKLTLNDENCPEEQQSLLDTLDRITEVSPTGNRGMSAASFSSRARAEKKKKVDLSSQTLWNEYSWKDSWNEYRHPHNKADVRRPVPYRTERRSGSEITTSNPTEWARPLLVEPASSGAPKNGEPRSSSATSYSACATAPPGSKGGTPYGVIITGKALMYLEGTHEELFDHHVAPILLGARTVVCCRVTPDQKAFIVRMVRKRGGMTCAIGDGGNDVAMIQEAHIGVGISGNEGLQAARAADYCFAEFRSLAPLLLVHGHTAFQRTAYIVQFSFYKSMIIAWCQWMYNSKAAFTGVSFFDSFSLAMWNSAISGLLVIFYLMDRQLEPKALLADPKMYSMSQCSRYLNKVTFLGWIVRALWQSTIVFWMTYYIFSDEFMLSNGRSFGELTLFLPTYMALLLLCLCETVLMAHTLSWLHWASQAVSFLGLILLYYIYSAVPELDFYDGFNLVIVSKQMWASLFVMTGAAFTPRAFVAALDYWFFPNVLQWKRAVCHRLFWMAADEEEVGTAVAMERDTEALVSFLRSLVPSCSIFCRAAKEEEDEESRTDSVGEEPR